LKLDLVRIPSGEVELAGLHYRPEPHANGTLIVYAHGFTSGKYSMDGLAAYLAGHGYTGISFDFVGHKLGGSGGEMREPADAVRNLSDVVAWIRDFVPCRQIVIAGHSLGGICTLAVAAAERELRGPAHPPLGGLVCLCVGSRPGQALTGLLGRTMAMQRGDYVAGTLASDFLKSLEGLPRAAAHLDGLPALFVAARRDILVSTDQVHAIASLAGPGASVAEIDCSHVEAPGHSRGAILEWLERNGL
jgi:pimeloyl-ACP methyl ester carboxylesterase